MCLVSVGIERLKLLHRSLSERSNKPSDHCTACANCTLSAVNGGQIFLSPKGSNCPPLLIPRTWVIDSGRGGHVVQLTVERHLVAAAPEAGILKFQLKVRNVSI